MVKHRKNPWVVFGIPFFLIIVIVLSLAVFQRQSIRIAQRQVDEKLHGAAEDQTRLFRIMINDRLLALEVLSKSIVLQEDTSLEQTETFLQSVRDQMSCYRAWITTGDGTSYSNDGKTIEIGDMDCYKVAMSGKSGIDYVHSKLNDEWVYLIWAPLQKNGKTVGAIFCTMDVEGFRTSLVSRAYGERDFSFVCASDGAIVIGSERADNTLIGENILDVLSHATFQTGDCNQLQQDLKTGTSGTLSYQLGDQKRYAIYQPIGCNGWTMVIAADGEVIHDSVRTLTQNGYMLFIVILCTSLGFVAFIVLTNRQQKRKLLYDATHDPLTGLLNRAAFLQQVQKLLQTAQPQQYSLYCIDIENFKVINDQFGHEEGDRLLRYMADCILRYEEKNGGIACRDIADIFLVFKPNAAEHLNRATQACQSDLSQYDLPICITARFGIYLVEDLKLSVPSMIDRAMLAQRSVKGMAEKHVAYYDDAIRQRLLHEQTIVGEMEQALLSHQFELWLQPQYDQRTGSLVSAEALVRWNHPTEGMIRPDEFIPLFEKNGFIVRMDQYIWEQACLLLQRWQQEGRTLLPISVNVSRLDLYEPDFCDRLSELVQKYGLTPKMLHLEITESACTDAPQVLLDAICTLRQRGFYLELDDFGKGYSSLNSLKDIPVDMLKLDMRFLSAGSGERGGMILDTMVQMARKLGIDVIAEGVETPQQAQFLKKIGCNLVQGYLFAKPMPVQDFETHRDKRSSAFSG